MAKHASLTQIANRLGISHSTVSRALRDNPRISQETRSKVQNLAAELGYQPNRSAPNFNRGKTLQIGVIVPDISVHFFAQVVEGIQSVLEAKEYSLMLFHTGESQAKESVAIDQFIRYRVDGVLAAISMNTKSHKHYDKLLKLEVPLVFYDRVINALPVPKVITDDYHAAFTATEHLIQIGCRHIAHITASINLNNSNNRLYGYLDALKAYNIEVDESLIHYYEFEQSSIDRFLTQVLQKRPDMDGLFVFNDYVANHAINFLHKQGKSIPGDISVIGFSDEPIATHMTPQLSSVQQSGLKMGQLAAEKLMELLAAENCMIDEKIVIYPDLILRQSTRDQSV